MRRSVASDEKFVTVLDEWLQIHKSRIKPQTYAKYQYIFELHIFPQFKDFQICELTEELINSYVYEKITSGKLDCSGGLSPSIVRVIIYLIKQTLVYAQKQGCDVQDFFIKRPQTTPARHDVLRENEQRQLESVLLMEVDSYKLGVLISLYLGLRIGEVCALRWENINLDSKTIRVDSTIQRIKNFEQSNAAKTTIEVVLPKSAAAVRDIPIPTFLHHLLIKVKSTSNGENAYFLTGTDKRPLEPRTYTYHFKKYLRVAQIRETNYHTLRHTFATRCIANGFDVKSLSEILGHSSVTTTLNRYVHSSLERKRQQVELLKPLFVVNRVGS